MQTAQRQLADWFRRKIDAARRDAKDALDNLEFARRSGLKHDSFVRASRTADRRVTFYEKCLAAVELGYAIVPDFPVDVFAIRVRRARPLVTSAAEHTFTHFPPQHLQRAQVMPAGEGRYVTPHPYVSTRETTVAGAERKTYQTLPTEFDEELEFPVEIAKPAVLAATQQALALKLFDEIGCLPGPHSRGRDPIVIGRIYNGGVQGRGDPVAFLIAWWIDTRVF